MIGGTVIEVIKLPNRIWVNCEEPDSTSKCAIYVERNAASEQIQPADSVWWQGGFAMWTPYGHERTDVQIPRIGFSGVKRPEI